MVSISPFPVPFPKYTFRLTTANCDAVVKETDKSDMFEQCHKLMFHHRDSYPCWVLCCMQNHPDLLAGVISWTGHHFSVSSILLLFLPVPCNHFVPEFWCSWLFFSTQKPQSVHLEPKKTSLRVHTLFQIKWGEGNGRGDMGMGTVGWYDLLERRWARQMTEWKSLGGE